MALVNAPPWRRTAAALTVTLGLFLLAPACRAESSAPLWKYALDSKLQSFKITTLGDLVVVTERGVVYLDGATGSAKWKRPSVEFYWDGIDRAKGTLYAWISSKDSTEVVDCGTGANRWSLWSGLPGDPRGFTTVEHLGLTVACVKHQNQVSLVGLDLESGDVRWRGDSLFVNWPEPPKDDDHQIGLHNAPQGLLVAEDSTAYFWPMLGGPIRIDLRTGSLLWRSQDAARAFAKPPRYEDPSWDSEAGTIAIASRRQVVAIRGTDGSVLWKKSGDYPADIDVVVARAGRLVVVGLKKPFYDVLDLGTGSSVLGEPHKVKGLTAINVGEQQFLYVADGKLRALDLSTGAEREIAKVDLKHDDSIEGIRVRESGYILQSRQNIVALDRDGKVRYHRDYEAPSGSFFSNLAILAGYAVATPPRTDPEREAAKSMEHLAVVPRLADRLAAVVAAKDCAYFYTDRPDSKGGSGFSLVRVDRETGEELGRIWLDQRDPVYRIDHATGTIFVKSDREIVAYRF